MKSHHVHIASHGRYLLHFTLIMTCQKLYKKRLQAKKLPPKRTTSFLEPGRCHHFLQTLARQHLLLYLDMVWVLTLLQGYFETWSEKKNSTSKSMKQKGNM